MEAILYAEVYLICMLFAGMLVWWTARSGTRSTRELWLKRMLLSFLLNFVSNFLFTIFNRVWLIEDAVIPLSYTFKTAYFVTLVIGVYCCCGYAETELGSKVFEKGHGRAFVRLPLIVALAMPAINLFTHWMFDFDEAYSYQRHFLFQAELAFLFVCSSVCSVRLLRRAKGESVPGLKAHMRLTASFPLCILAALILSYLGEAVPVICVSIIVELQCIYMGTTRHQISLDPLTQVNNRQNLIGFMNYKLKNHSGELYLLMIDLDKFKSINDTYGHLAGDRALVQLSGVLKRACAPMEKRPYIARYGGDEFIIVMEGTRERVDALCEDIHTKLDEINAASDSYKLLASIGVARWSEGMDYKALLSQADTGMYGDKSARKAARRV